MTKPELGFPCRMDLMGSRATCNPAPVDTDEDWLVEVAPSITMYTASQKLRELGFQRDPRSNTYDEEHGGFRSWRRGILNLIVTADKKFAANIRLASAVAKKLNLLKKEDRITLFRAILYKEAPKNVA